MNHPQDIEIIRTKTKSHSLTTAHAETILTRIQLSMDAFDFLRDLNIFGRLLFTLLFPQTTPSWGWNGAPQK
jgi:hypothetical protein